MDYKIIFFALFVFFAGSGNIYADPSYPLDEPRTWKSFNEVLNVYLLLPTSGVHSVFPDYRTPQAISLGLRSADGLDTVKKFDSNGKKRGQVLEASLVSNKSLREIAILGLMMALSETSNVSKEHSTEWAKKTYVVKEVGTDVLEQRDKVLEALDVLSDREVER